MPLCSSMTIYHVKDSPTWKAERESRNTKSFISKLVSIYFTDLEEINSIVMLCNDPEKPGYFEKLSS